MDMDIGRILRLIVLVLASAAMVLGILVIAGVFVPVNFPEQFRSLVGVVIFLYGAYRFVVAFFRKKESSESD